MKVRPEDGQKPTASATREAIRQHTLASVAAVVAWVVAVLPAFLSAWFPPWIAALVSAAALIGWVKLVPAGPGLVQGVLCLGGAAAIFGSLVAYVVVAIREIERPGT